jgi:hypothetical protein
VIKSRKHVSPRESKDASTRMLVKPIPSKNSMQGWGGKASSKRDSEGEFSIEDDNDKFNTDYDQTQISGDTIIVMCKKPARSPTRKRSTDKIKSHTPEVIQI